MKFQAWVPATLWLVTVLGAVVLVVGTVSKLVEDAVHPLASVVWLRPLRGSR